MLYKCKHVKHIKVQNACGLKNFCWSIKYLITLKAGIAYNYQLISDNFLNISLLRFILSKVKILTILKLLFSKH